MGSHFGLVVFLLSVSVSVSISKPVLTTDYYQTTCPNFNQIVRTAVMTKQLVRPFTAAGTLRLFFHDCFVEGCDASILVGRNPSNPTERDDEHNESLLRNGFEVVARAKTALELACPGVVSCADILAQVTRDLVMTVGGPYYNVPLGRKDSRVSAAHHAGQSLPTPDMSVDRLLQMFGAKGFTLRDLVALSGAHTLGVSHCKEFSNRLYSFNETTRTDPDLNPALAATLKVLCRTPFINQQVTAFNDLITPNTFDNMYFKNLKRGLGLLASDNILVKDKRTRPYVKLYAANQTAFFEHFASAMEKLSTIGVKGDGEGEIRRRCDMFNTV